MRKVWGELWEIVRTIVVAGAVVVLVRAFIFQPFLVSGASMEPNIAERNYLIIDEVTYRFQDPMRGDVVVFRYPGDPKTFYIKRIIGLPGDEVTVRNGRVAVNGALLDESAYLGNARTFGDTAVSLKRDEYFVLGDNRENSYDSRSWGPLGRRQIIGKALVRLYPFNAITLFESPAYQ
jgi:signal peptidase I